MNPKARSSAPTMQETAGVTLDALAEQVLQLADGTRTVAMIAREPNASEREVWTALDWLSDAGLLERRTAPPAANRVCLGGQVHPAGGSFPGSFIRRQCRRQAG